MGVLAPCVTESAPGDDRAEGGVRKYIHPGSGRCRASSGRDDIFAPVRRKTPDSIKEDQISFFRRIGLERSLGPMGEGRRQSRNSHFCRYATVDLVGQRSAVIGNDHAGD